MKLRFFPASIVFISSYFPLTLIFVIQNFNKDSRYYFNHPKIVFFIVIFEIFACVLSVLFLHAKTDGETVAVLNSKNASLELVNYTIPYIISFFTIDFNDTKQLVCFCIFMLLMFLLTYKSSALFVNPLFLIFGYRLHEIEYESTTSGKIYNKLFLVKTKYCMDDIETFKYSEVSDSIYVVSEIISRK